MREWVTKSLPTCFKKLAAQFKALQNDNHLNTIKEQVRKKKKSRPPQWHFQNSFSQRLHYHKTPFFLLDGYLKKIGTATGFSRLLTCNFWSLVLVLYNSSHTWMSNWHLKRPFGCKYRWYCRYLGARKPGKKCRVMVKF